MSIVDTSENETGGLGPISLLILSVDPTDGCVNLSRRDLDSAKFDRQPSRQCVHRFLGEVEAIEGNVHRQDGERFTTVGDIVTRPTSSRVPAGHGVHPSDIGEGGEGTKGGVSFGYETVGTVGASDRG